MCSILFNFMLYHWDWTSSSNIPYQIDTHNNKLISNYLEIWGGILQIWHFSHFEVDDLCRFLVKPPGDIDDCTSTVSLRSPPASTSSKDVAIMLTFHLHFEKLLFSGQDAGQDFFALKILFWKYLRPDSSVFLAD